MVDMSSKHQDPSRPCFKHFTIRRRSLTICRRWGSTRLGWWIGNLPQDSGQPHNAQRTAQHFQYLLHFHVARGCFAGLHGLDFVFRQWYISWGLHSVAIRWSSDPRISDHFQVCCPRRISIDKCRLVLHFANLCKMLRSMSNSTIKIAQLARLSCELITSYST